MTPESFDTEVYTIVREIPAGRVASYGMIARLSGAPTHARRVGRALSEAPKGLPCHRVVGSDGHTASHWAEQRTLLEKEGIPFRKNGCVDLRLCLWEVLRELKNGDKTDNISTHSTFNEG